MRTSRLGLMAIALLSAACNDMLCGVDLDRHDRAASSAGQTPAAPESKPVEAVSPPRSACSFVTKEEMASILGDPILEAKPVQDTDDKTVCAYKGPEDTTLTEVTIEWRGGAAGMAATKGAGDIIKDGVKGGPIVPGGVKGTGIDLSSSMEGLGDDAAFLTGGLMTVRKGAALITIQLILQTKERQKGRLIAEKILARW